MENIFKPNLFIPGAAKSGTTTLHKLLNLHPDICMSSIKEPIFWNKNALNIPEKIDWYNSLFNDPYATFFGESTTSYMYYYSFIDNVKMHYSEDPKFIFILRNPIDRCYSHYWWMNGRGQEKKTFKNAVENDYNTPFREYGYVPNLYYQFGLYGQWIEKFYKNFNSENIKIITLEALISDKLQTLNCCFRFLGVDELEFLPDLQSNKTSKMLYPKMYHFLMKTASGKYKFTRIAKYILPKKSNEKIKTAIKKSNYFSKSIDFDYPKITTLQRKWLKSLYEDDIRHLKQITSLPFKEWPDFK